VYEAFLITSQGNGTKRSSAHCALHSESNQRLYDLSTRHFVSNTFTWNTSACKCRLREPLRLGWPKGLPQASLLVQSWTSRTAPLARSLHQGIGRSRKTMSTGIFFKISIASLSRKGGLIDDQHREPKGWQTTAGSHELRQGLPVHQRA
jgi:hypothetical protein